MRTRLFPTICLAALVGAVINLTAYSQALPPVQDTNNSAFYMPGEILIKFKADVTDEQLNQAVRLAGVTSARQIHTPAMKARGDKGISCAFTSRPVPQAIQALQNHPAIEYAEPNWVYQHQYVPNDLYFTGGQLWGMYGDLSSPANSFGSQAAEAWASGYTGSREVVVGVIDEGVDIAHGDLSANIWVNPGEIAGDGFDNDGNGYVNDVNGWDFYNNDNSVYDGTSDDHGTHVTGTIGAMEGNGTGVVGVNWAVSIISGKFLGPNGGSTADAIEAVEYFTHLKQAKGVNIVALNNSWGGGGYSQGLHDAIIRGAKAGILFVAAAGNGNWVGRAINNDSSPYYPAGYNTTVGTSTESAAAYDAVISVTAIDSSGNKASWANYGAKTVDLGAPGVGIISTLPGGYGYADGTSMATPHVTGAIALYASTHPSATAADIKTAILSATAPTASLVNKTLTGGRLALPSQFRRRLVVEWA